METPFSEPHDSSEPSHGSGGAPVPSSGAHREACRFLEREVLPLLERDGSPKLAQAVRAAVAHGSLTALESLPERLRRELLMLLEEVVAAGHESSPRSLVQITAAVSAFPSTTDLVALPANVPAR
jgi:hypothetical protein